MMKNGTIAAAIIATVATTGLAIPALAQYADQPNQFQDRGPQDRNQDRDGRSEFRERGRANAVDEAYRAGYRAGYDTARARRRYDDRPVAFNGSRDTDARWRQRYAQTYTYNDDSYYRSCRTSADPAGVIAGALIGGLVGNAASRGNGGATAAGVIVGGALGASMTKNLDCEDQSFAYKSYYDGFNSGRPNSTYEWRNPRNGHYGNFRVIGYANDPDGFRCANYRQEVFINGRPQMTTGRACQQPDGIWAIVG